MGHLSLIILLIVTINCRWEVAGDDLGLDCLTCGVSDQSECKTMMPCYNLKESSDTQGQFYMGLHAAGVCKLWNWNGTSDLQHKQGDPNFNYKCVQGKVKSLSSEKEGYGAACLVEYKILPEGYNICIFKKALTCFSNCDFMVEHFDAESSHCKTIMQRPCFTGENPPPGAPIGGEAPGSGGGSSGGQRLTENSSTMLLVVLIGLLRACYFLHGNGCQRQPSFSS